jgi:hypothetical protein
VERIRDHPLLVTEEESTYSGTLLLCNIIAYFEAKRHCPKVETLRPRQIRITMFVEWELVWSEPVLDDFAR